MLSSSKVEEIKINSQKTIYLLYFLIIFSSYGLANFLLFDRIDSAKISSEVIRIQDVEDSTKTSLNSKDLPSLIYYNRVPKCASTLITNLLNATSLKTNKFRLYNFHYRGINFNTRPGSKDERDFLTKIKALVVDEASPPYVYIRHQYFVDIREKLQKENINKDLSIININFVRDPIERFISDYYFARFGSEITQDLKSLQKVKHVLPETINESIATCISKRRIECRPEKMTQTMVKFFCGNDQILCDTQNNPKKALDKAKNNLEQKYAVVGIYDKMEESLKLFEKKVPILKGIYQNYIEMYSENQKSAQKTQHSHEESAETLEQLRSFLKYDVELYEFALAVFEKNKNKFM